SSKSLSSLNTLAELLLQVGATVPEKYIVIIVDQFEEHFITNASREQRESFEKALFALAEPNFPIRILFCLRKEFVDDLLDLGRVVPQLQNLQWRLPLRNFSSDTAVEILKKVVQSEDLRFSDELQSLVISDLSRNGQVRPVEFQLVLTTLLGQAV